MRWTISLSRFRFAVALLGSVMAVALATPASQSALALDSCTIAVTASGSASIVGDSGGTEYRLAQTFTMTSTGHLTEFRVYQTTNIGSPTGLIYWEVRGSPAGSVLISGSFVSGPGGTIVVTVVDGPLLYYGNSYALVFYADNQATESYFRFQRSISSVYADGEISTSSNGGANWSTQSGNDLQFSVITDASCATATPTEISSATATITPTPTETPTPTPQYFIEVTSTTGAPMRLERSATYGDVITFGGELALAIIGFIAFGYFYWRSRVRA